MNTDNHLSWVLRGLWVNEEDFSKLKQDLEDVVSREADYNLDGIMKILEWSINVVVEHDEIFNKIKEILLKSAFKDAAISILQENLKETKEKLKKANKKIKKIEEYLEKVNDFDSFHNK